MAELVIDQGSIDPIFAVIEMGPGLLVVVVQTDTGFGLFAKGAAGIGDEDGVGHKAHFLGRLLKEI